MKRIGINISIDMNKIDKGRFFEGKKGKYLDLTTFVDIESVNDHGDNGFVTQRITAKERDQGLKMPILGNVKIFYQVD